jgi:hypothetical protein
MWEKELRIADCGLGIANVKARSQETGVRRKKKRSIPFLIFTLVPEFFFTLVPSV